MPRTSQPSPSCAKLQTQRSTWTPLKHPLTNSKVFEEKRSLVSQWFDRWSDHQRKAVLQDFVSSCSVDQLRFLSISVSRQLPLQAADFTSLFPRTLSLYIFSFLDPRSLCRCAQVSWHWKSLVELDRLWMPKCLRLGWCSTFCPTAFEQSVWKRHYIQTVQELRLSLQQTQPSMPKLMAPAGPKEPPESAHINQELLASNNQRPKSRSGLEKEQPANTPPWRVSDRHPKDTIRFNYLDNLDPVKAERARQSSSTCSTSKTEDSRRKTPSEAKSLMFLTSSSLQAPDLHHLTQTQTPPWASRSPNPPILTKSLLSLAQWNAGIRPRPVRTPLPHLSLEVLRASRRSYRSLPSAPLFTV